MLGDDIFEIFCEEVEEISGNLLEWFPQWESSRDDHELLTEIRRAFHTLKGSGRMAGAFALGDFAWVHEDMLNQVLNGQLEASDPVADQIGNAVQELKVRLGFFQQAQEKDERVASMVASAEALMQQPQAIERDLPELSLIDDAEVLDFSTVTDAAAEPESGLPIAEIPLAVETDNSEPDPIVDLEPEPEPVSGVSDDNLPEFDPIADLEPETETAPDISASDDNLPEFDPIADLEPEGGLVSDTSDGNLSEFDPIVDLEPETGPASGQKMDTGLPEFDPIADLETADPGEQPGQSAEADITAPDTGLVVTEEVSAAAEDDFDAETRLVWELFWEELPEQLISLDQNLQRLRDDPHELEAIRELEREFHTLKGGARMARLTVLADVSHEAEDLLCHIPRSAGLGEQDIATLQQAVDQLHTLADECRQQAAAPDMSESPQPVASEPLADDGPPAEPVMPVTEKAPADGQRPGWSESGSLLERMLVEQAGSLPDMALLEGGRQSAGRSAEPAEPVRQASANSQETIRLSAGFIDGLIDKAVGLNVQQMRLSEHLSGMGLDIEELTRTVARLRQQIRALEVESEAQIHDGRSSWLAMQKADGSFDPLEMDQYAEIQRISRSLAESLNDLVNLEADLDGQVRKGEQLLQEDMRTTRWLRQELLETRLVALTMLVPRLRRLVRQTAGELERQVTLEVQGEECELDRNLLQHMTPPLEHLIRNAISHGIEPPDEREKNGKPRTGAITLSVSRDDSQIVIHFRDDGRGLDRKRLYEKAVSLGLVEKGKPIADAELDRLILHSGFSTAEQVSQIAGRGIGMDVVYSEIKAMGGSLEIASAPGEWTEFTMRLPFTLVVNPVLLAEVQEQVFAIPITGIQGLARLSGGQVEQCLQSATPVLEFAGERYPLRQLADLLGQQGARQEFPADERFPVVFIQAQGHAVAWLIDRVRGRREVVLQPLGSLFKHCHLYSAATMASDGRVLLVPDMVELARRVGGQQSMPDLTEAVAGETNPAGPPRIMVVDDSVTVRRVTEKFLGTRDYQVVTAKDGMEALERVGEFLPDAVLLDIEMPRMDGFELLRHLRRDPQWEMLPIIMISSRTAQKHREHAGELGATGFLGKPYQNEVLLDAIEEVLSSGHEKNSPRVWEGTAA